MEVIEVLYFQNLVLLSDSLVSRENRLKSILGFHVVQNPRNFTIIVDILL